MLAIQNRTPIAPAPRRPPAVTSLVFNATLMNQAIFPSGVNAMQAASYEKKNRNVPRLLSDS